MRSWTDDLAAEGRAELERHTRTVRRLVADDSARCSTCGGRYPASTFYGPEHRAACIQPAAVWADEDRRDFMARR